MRDYFINPEFPNNQRWRFEAHVGFDRNWFSYYLQYKNVAFDLIDGITKGKTPIDTVSLPLLFCIRHCLELGLKANILKLEKVNSGIKFIDLRGHSLEFFYKRFVEHINEVLKRIPQNSTIHKDIAHYLSKLEPLKTKLHQLDQGSYSFRYPVDPNHKPNFEWSDKIFIDEIVELFYEIQPFLLFTDLVLAEAGIINDV